MGGGGGGSGEPVKREPNWSLLGVVALAPALSLVGLAARSRPQLATGAGLACGAAVLAAAHYGGFAVSVGSK